MSAAQDKSPKFSDTVRVMRIGLRGMYRSRLPQMSAALAFRTLFALIPMLVISVAAIGAFAEPDDVRNILKSALDSAGISDIMVHEADSAGAQAQDDVDGQTPETSIDPVEMDTPDQAGESDDAVRLEEFIQELIDRMLSIPFGAIGAVGVLTLIYAAISMLIEIERVFNNVFRAQVGKSWGKRITQYWAIITLVPILLFATYFVSERFRGVDNVVAGSVAGSVISIAITSLLLLVAYTIIPNTRVHMRTGIVGAIVAAILWELAKWGFRLYMDYSVSYAMLYSSLALLPLFMLWIYLTWLIILFGLQVSYGLQHIELARRIDEEDSSARLTSPAAVLGVLAIIAERFIDGKTTGVDRLTDELSLPADVVDTMLEKLGRATILQPVDGGEDRYILARPAENILLADAMLAMGEITDAGLGSTGGWAQALDRLESAQRSVIEGQTIADLIQADTRTEGAQ